MNLRAKLSAYVVNNVDPGFDPDEHPLLDVLDSVSLLGLILFIDQEVGIHVDLSDLRMQMFSTIETLASELEALREPAGGEAALEMP